MACLYTILTTLALAQASAEESRWVTLDQKEGTCILRDFGERGDGYWNGLKVWYGQGLPYLCSFFVSTPCDQNVISAGGCFHGTEAPIYYCFNVAFFDKDENLIACHGGGLPDQPPVTKGGTTMIAASMPIPKDVHDGIHSYKVAYYESDLAIGKVAWDEHDVSREIMTDAITEQTTERSWPLWKSAGELRGSAFQVRAGSRLLPLATQEDWRAETTEGTCSLKKAAMPNSSDEQRQRFLVAVGDTLTLRANCRLEINKDNAIETWINIRNPSDRNMFWALYVAFFDRYGNLVGSTQSDAMTEANGTSPSVVIDGKLQRITSSFGTIMPVPIPLGFEDKVTSYKVTMYESEEPIGQKKDGKVEGSQDPVAKKPGGQ